MVHTFLFAVLILTAAAAATAQESPFKGGMRYSAVGRKPAAAKDKMLKNMSVKAPGQDEDEENETQSKVWKKYKTLAAGKVEDEPQQKKPEPLETAEPAPAPKPQPTGLAGLIQQYHQNKAQQKEMRTITMRRGGN